MLRAFDATTLRELWNSTLDPSFADLLGDCSKFSPPTIANGKVYVATFSNRLVVYGLKP
jgi:outer membrane protein assembly factor BamB